jgi:hypothetical protein
MPALKIDFRCRTDGCDNPHHRIALGPATFGAQFAWHRPAGPPARPSRPEGRAAASCGEIAPLRRDRSWRAAASAKRCAYACVVDLGALVPSARCREGPLTAQAGTPGYRFEQDRVRPEGDIRHCRRPGYFRCAIPLREAGYLMALSISFTSDACGPLGWSSRYFFSVSTVPFGTANLPFASTVPFPTISDPLTK